MNHYPHHIGDFSKDTMGLSQGEIGAYRLLMDAAYAGEGGVAADEVYPVTRAHSAPERKNTDRVLKKHWELREGRYYQKRIDEEVATYRERSAKASASARKRWSDGNADGMPTHSEGIPNADAKALLTSNQGKSKQGGPDGPAPSGPVWGEGLKVLTDAGTAEKDARRILGKLISQWHERDVVDALIASVGKPDPKAYCLAVLQKKTRKPKSTPEADAVLLQLREQYGASVVMRDPKTFWDPHSQRVWSITGERLAAA